LGSGDDENLLKLSGVGRAGDRGTGQRTAARRIFHEISMSSRELDTRQWIVAVVPALLRRVIQGRVL
jgi:hypothetical protein